LKLPDENIYSLFLKRDSPVCISSSAKKQYIKNKGHFINNYLVKKNIGIGVFSKVKLCKDMNNNKEYAIKIINKKNLMK
jgi:serine/threonine protein kinase